MTYSTNEIYINTKTLDDIESQELWAGIKKEKPALAELMRDDPLVQGLIKTFNASFNFEINEFNHFSKVGKKLMNKNNDNT